MKVVVKSKEGVGVRGTERRWCALVVEERPRSEDILLTCAKGVRCILPIRDLKSRLTLINRCVTQNISGEVTK